MNPNPGTPEQAPAPPALDADYDHEYMECKRKKPYKQKGLALRRVRHLRRLMDTKRIDAYRCRFCPHWHVGHTPWYKEPQ